MGTVAANVTLQPMIQLVRRTAGSLNECKTNYVQSSIQHHATPHSFPYAASTIERADNFKAACYTRVWGGPQLDDKNTAWENYRSAHCIIHQLQKGEDYIITWIIILISKIKNWKQALEVLLYLICPIPKDCHKQERD